MNYRSYFSDQLGGRGLEIGPLHRPIPRHDRMTVDTVDRLTVVQMRQHYPELVEHVLCEPNIIDDAESLVEITNDTYDFAVASHVVEHMRSPIDAIKSWLRVLKPGGLLYLVVPDYREIFDRDRPLTTLGHVVADYSTPDESADWAHYREYAELVDKAKEEVDIRAHALDLRCRGYSIHFHTFNYESFKVLLDWIGKHVYPLEILEGMQGAGDSEFHFLVKKP